MDLFLRENAMLNLSACRTPEKCWTGNILDSLSLLDLPLKFSILNSQPGDLRHATLARVGRLSMLDVGTGGGFPLLPLAIAIPDAGFTGMDSTRKKINAVRRIVAAMDLKNVALACGRAEALGKDWKYREQFDVVTSRAVAEMNVLLEYCSPFAKPGGKIILWKSLDVEQELSDSRNAQKEFLCEFSEKHVYELPGDFGKRQLIIFDKMGKLSEKYPRAVGAAAKKPIL